MKLYQVILTFNVVSFLNINQVEVFADTKETDGESAIRSYGESFIFAYLSVRKEV